MGSLLMPGSGFYLIVNPAAKDRLDALTAGEKLYVSIELTNPATQFAVQIQTLDYHHLA
jgi:hypothetical protein